MENREDNNIVYCATNKINGKKYIGYTVKSLAERKQTHKYRANTKDTKYHTIFRLAIRKYGWENFEWDILSRVNTKEEAIVKEIELISKLNTFTPNGYNISKGGNGGFISKEVNKKISISLKRLHENKKLISKFSLFSSEERINNAKKAWETKRKKDYIPKKGYKISEEGRRKMSTSKRKLSKTFEWVNKKSNEYFTGTVIELLEYSTDKQSQLYKVSNKKIESTKSGWCLKDN